MPRLVRFANTEIATLDVIAFSGRIDLRDALRWAEANRDVLEAKWNELSGAAS
jgi:hypothetical protein